MEKERKEEEEKPTLKVERAGGPLTSAHLDAGERAEDGYFLLFSVPFLPRWLLVYCRSWAGEKKIC